MYARLQLAAVHICPASSSVQHPEQLVWIASGLQCEDCECAMALATQLSACVGLTCEVYAPIGSVAVITRAAHIKGASRLVTHNRQCLSIEIVQVEATVSGALCGLSVALNVFVGSINDQEEPEELVAALCEDVFPHAVVDDPLTPAMGLC